MMFYKSVCTYCNNGSSGFGFAVCFIKVYVVTVIVLDVFKISVSENIQKCDFVEK